MRDRLTQAIGDAKRNRHHVGVMFIDLDRFKQVNDQHGHNTGDALLVAVTDRIRHLVRSDDEIFRQGGDEFIVLISDLKHTDMTTLIATRLIEELSKPFKLAGHVINIGASIGIAIYPDDAVTIDQLLDAADTAMYQAKNAGRGQFSAPHRTAV